MTHVLSFDVSKRRGDRVTVITPCVDGALLTCLVEQFERSQGWTDPAGGYGGLVPEHFRCGALLPYFLGKAETPYVSSTPGRIFLLGCECGEVGCWPLASLVDARDSAVIWQRFEQPCRASRDYSTFGPFAFDRVQYEQALRSLPGYPDSR